ncbi:WG repeat-containing protein [Dyadobacter sp. CY356]|uniref:WG repeat-containing protein n=1 Tax=Dyadobacter sp. CY356 TaxID=2906442 RepID=UPI001F3ADCEC|nr:WG repeat-containing protein [Dyadobacter sp. CY356]MCF0054781.1 WG repeat-containing protein [Dyadobacter sp. CY356]
MKKILFLCLILLGGRANGQNIKKPAIATEPDRSCENLLTSAKQSLAKEELTQARDYCEAGLLICEDLVGSFQLVLKQVNARIDSQKIEVSKAYESVRILAETNKNLIEAFYFYNGRIALAFNTGRYGFVNKKGETLIDYKYTSAIPFGQKYGYAIVKKQEQGPEYLLDTTKTEYKLTRNVNALSDTSVTAGIASIRTKKERLAILNAKQLKILFIEDARGVNQTLLRRLIQGLKYMPKLVALGLSNTGLTSTPKDLFAIPNLLTLDLSNNKLGKSHDLFEGDSLQKSCLIKLDLSNNELDSIPRRIELLTELRYLNLLGNNIPRKKIKLIQTWLPNCTILYKDYYEEPQNILAKIKANPKMSIDSTIALYKRLTTLLKLYHREVPSEDGIKTSLYQNKAILAWWQSRKGTKSQQNVNSPNYDSLAYYQATLRDSLLVFNDSLPNDRIILFHLAQCYGNLGYYSLILNRYEESEMSCRRGLELYPSQTFIKLNLAHSLLWQGKFIEAKRTYQEFLVSNAACLGTLQDFEELKKARVPMHPDVPKIEAMISQLDFPITNK